jgi:hypothetical protein
MTEQLGNNEGCSKCKRQQPVACTARGAAGAKSGLGSRETERVQFTSQSAEGWPEETCGRVPNVRHRLRGDGRSSGLGSVAGRGSEPRVGWDGMGMQDGSVVKRDDKPALSEAFLPWSRRQLSEAGKGPVEVNRGRSMRRRLLLVGEKWR